MKIINAKKTSFFWVYIVLSVLIAICALIVAPIWAKTDLFFKGWGAKLIDTLLAVAILYYVIIYLFRRVKSSSGAIQILIVVEIVLLSLIALGLLLSQFKIISISDPCQVLGVALWLRGTIELVRAYYYRGASSKMKYSLLSLAIAILMVSVGVYIFARPVLSRVSLQWVLVAFLLIASIYTLLYGISASPKRK
ncbi:MAG: hypothetical protein IKA43_01080 [Clostridia bacterium]|nr:hypothetical protein [Clostridia bacterium]